ncbi:glycoside hydrolase family 1 protein [Klebsiella sp. BIGb0407]|uniref:glycoside hydrolase family 1 protein n=1 Tax=Klebsiella sp. BIGb0407 TaxID=2940603 RepID=UPI00286DD6AC|nr:glycoside hydrolase family 1 protein [Klebsiella sp. BIGb0407]MCS3434278.1 6-phospho-beta-glucosidase [Klebsiella sp. BIGb0407]
MEFEFPKGFWWGSASSATQSEGSTNDGGKKQNIWDHWFSLEPNRFHGQIGPSETSTFYKNYRDDILLMKRIGHNSFRTSISWSRLMPDGENINDEAVKFYNDVINELIESDIEPVFGLFHFDMPLYWQNQGGWESRHTVIGYEKYARACFALFGDRVKNWMTFNEPVVVVEGGYLYDFHYPNKVNFKSAAQVAFHMMLAHSFAVKAYKGMAQSGRIGIVLNLTPSYPRSDNEQDLKASFFADLFFNRSFLDPAIHGQYPQELIDILKEHDQLPICEPGDLDSLREGKVDFLGINYYQPRRVKARSTAINPESPFMPDWFFENYEMPGRKMNIYRGWEIYEKGIYDILINLRDNYGNIPCYISENGMGVENEERFISDSGQIDDHYRIDFIREHLKWIHRAIGEGSQCHGYHLWTFIDNWSWMNAYKNRYGFISLDINSQVRTIKKSGEWFADVSTNNGF